MPGRLSLCYLTFNFNRSTVNASVVLVKLGLVYHEDDKLSDEKMNIHKRITAFMKKCKAQHVKPQAVYKNGH